VIDAERLPAPSTTTLARISIDDDFGSSNNQGNSSSSGDFLCYEDRSLSSLDFNDDGVITLDELDELAGDPDVDDVIEMLEDDGYDGIEYQNCETI
jgi:hypothetical protein